ncbi:MAG: inositol monophosphatase [Bacteroides sp.]|nr:inositol monophosphatase [Bacteroides sp.]
MQVNIYDLPRLTTEVCRIAKETGAFQRREQLCFRSEEIEVKGRHDYVSYVDRRSEERLVTELTALLPEAGFITEEGSAGHAGEELLWIIDPLDGTTNFIHRYSPYGVSIALCRGRELLLGVVYEVTRDECFYAWKAGPAYLNGQQICVSDTSAVEGAFLIVELPYNDEAYKATALYLIDALYGVAGGIRMNGSAAVALCEVAAGRCDGWIEAFVKPWDHAAGTLILLCAGGRVTDFLGREDTVYGSHIVATNGKIHQEIYNELMYNVPLRELLGS